MAEIDKRSKEERDEARNSFEWNMDQAGIYERDKKFWLFSAALNNAGTMLDSEWATKTILEIEHVIASAVALRERMFADEDPVEGSIKEAIENMAASSAVLVSLAKDRLKNPRGRVPLVPDDPPIQYLSWLIRAERKVEALEVLEAIGTDDPGNTLRCKDPVAAHQKLICYEVENLLGLHRYPGGWDKLLQALLAKFPSALTTGDYGRPVALALTPWPSPDRERHPDETRKFKPPRLYLAKTLLLAGVRVKPGEHHVDELYPANWVHRTGKRARGTPKDSSFLSMVGNDTELAGLLIRAGHPLRFKGQVRIRDEFDNKGFMDGDVVEEVDEDFSTPRLNHESKSISKKWRVLFDSMPEVLDELTEKSSGGEQEVKSL
jgi:hypothetical protein